MRKVIFSIVMLVASCLQLNAQSRITSISLTCSPVGSAKGKISSGDEKYVYKFDSYLNFTFGYEKQFKGGLTMLELEYAKGNFDRYELKGNSPLFDTTQDKDFMSIGFTAYYGYTINYQKRVQFPFYFGAGLDYNEGGALHNVGLAVAGKLRMKFYFTDHFGMFIGGNGRFSIGARGDKQKDGVSYNVYASQLNADIGLVYSF